eukprot:COSAG02_NODE_6051_length_3842_cov_7.726423_3_plen_106_part_00
MKSMCVVAHNDRVVGCTTRMVADCFRESTHHCSTLVGAAQPSFVIATFSSSTILACMARCASSRNGPNEMAVRFVASQKLKRLTPSARSTASSANEYCDVSGPTN